MVRRDDDQRAVREAGPLETLEDHAELRVHERDLPVVGVAGESSRVVARRLVRRVGIVVVDPEEPGRRGSEPLVEPLERSARGLVGRPLDVGRAPLVVSSRERVVVHLEAPVEPEPLLERKTRDERGRAVPGASERIGEGRDALRQGVVGVVADAVAERRQAGEDRGVRRPGDGRVGDGGVESHAAGGETVDHRRLRLLVAVAAEMICPQRVDRDEQDVWWCGSPRRPQRSSPPPRASRDEEAGNGQGRPNPTHASSRDRRRGGQGRGGRRATATALAHVGGFDRVLNRRGRKTKEILCVPPPSRQR